MIVSLSVISGVRTDWGGQLHNKIAGGRLQTCQERAGAGMGKDVASSAQSAEALEKVW